MLHYKRAKFCWTEIPGSTAEKLSTLTPTLPTEKERGAQNREHVQDGLGQHEELIKASTHEQHV